MPSSSMGEPLAACFVTRSQCRKLSPVSLSPKTPTQSARLTCNPPFVAATAVSTAATCPPDCPFWECCYYLTGLSKNQAIRLNKAAVGMTSQQVIAQEVKLIDRAFGGRGIPQDGASGGRDLRLHVGGDVGGTQDALMLAAAAHRWGIRGGGRVWTYTHRADEIPRDAWGAISVLGSAEIPADIEVLRSAGYAAAIVVPDFLSRRPFKLSGSSATVVPCPYELDETRTCVECRLCLDVDLLSHNLAIGFRAHGTRAELAKVVLQRLGSAAREEGGVQRNKNLGGEYRMGSLVHVPPGGAS